MSETLRQRSRFELEIKKSRFIAIADHCQDETQAREFLGNAGDAGATHNCWAWKSGQQYRFDDDGEPSGTAGRPILAAIEHQGMDQVAVVVIRYYGGIKLGTGGLARAYGGAASECLRIAETHELIVKQLIHVTLPFESVAVAHQIMSRHDATKAREQFTGEGVNFSIECPRDHMKSLIRDLTDASAGRIDIKSD